MRRIITLSLGIVALVLVGCRREDTTPEEAVAAMRQPVVFTASMDAYAVKATEASFEEGDVIGIFALEPFDEYNLRGTVSGSTVTLAQPLTWEPVRKAVFLAYYPYDDYLLGTSYSFSVRTDQTATGEYRRSDLRAAAAVTDRGETVKLAFRHILSKLTVKVVCEDTQEQATAVTIGKSIIEVRADLSNLTVELGSNQAEIEAGSNGSNGFDAILVPQTLSDLAISVSTNKGRTLTFHPAEPLRFDSGYAYVAAVTVPKEDTGEGAALTFTYSLTEWEDANVDFSENPES